MLVTDFTRIRSGSLLRAHGGFLMLYLRDVLADPPVWERLRCFVRSGRQQIEKPGALYAPVAAVALTPQEVRAEVKLVLVSCPRTLMRCRRSIRSWRGDSAARWTWPTAFVSVPQAWHDTAVFVSFTCARRGLPHFSAAATALLIEDSRRQAQDQFRQSAVFATNEAQVMESAAVARGRRPRCNARMWWPPARRTGTATASPRIDCSMRWRRGNVRCRSVVVSRPASMA